MSDTAYPLPPAYERQITQQLGADAPGYFASLAAPYLRGLRVNAQKPTDEPIAALVDGLGAPVPWAEGGFYLSADSACGASPLHEAGAYYLQEPSAMLPAALLSARPDETVLDLCAAPGGKSTQLGRSMNGAGLLVCNDPSAARAGVLSRNIERMGIPNAVVVCAEPEALALRWGARFDAILVDAPCSGEGMFRRHPESRAEWDEGAPERCAGRQRRILEAAVAMLKPGGRLCYSTCTFNLRENEQVIEALRADHPELSPVDFTVPVAPGRTLSSARGALHLYPHEVAGEGHFAALLRKEAGAPAPDPATRALPPPSKAALSCYAAFRDALGGIALPAPTAMLGDKLLSAPEALPPLDGVRVLRAGIALGRAKGRVFAPDHALAMALRPPYALPTLPLDEATARAYQRGEALPAPDGMRGYALATHHGLSLGFGKCSDGLFKNHYPKGLRRP